MPYNNQPYKPPLKKSWPMAPSRDDAHIAQHAELTKKLEDLMQRVADLEDIIQEADEDSGTFLQRELDLIMRLNIERIQLEREFIHFMSTSRASPDCIFCTGTD